MARLVVSLLAIKFSYVLGSDINHHRLTNETEGDYNFPVPQIENVYQAWKPIDYGHPLVDPTLHYVPPPLEVVQIGPRKEESDDYYYDNEDYESNGISDNNLNAMVYSGSTSKGLTEEIQMERAKQQAKVVKAEPGPYIADPSASPRLDLGEISLQPPQEYKPLKSGMYYVDDPHEEFREKKRNKNSGKRYRYYLQESERRQNMYQPPASSAGVYIPVSLLSTPPTITTTRKPYGEIVNKDFLDKLRPTTPRPRQTILQKSGGRAPSSQPKIGGGSREVIASLPHHNSGGGEQNIFPLGAPPPAPVEPRRRPPPPNRHDGGPPLPPGIRWSQAALPRLEGVLGPPRPDVIDSPGFVDRRSSSVSNPAHTWHPQNVSYYIEDREVVYPRDVMVYNTDTKSQVSQYSQAPVQSLESREHVFTTVEELQESSTRQQQHQFGLTLEELQESSARRQHELGPEQHKFQLIYSNEPAQIDTQPLNLVDSLSQRCLHGLPSFLKHLCVEKQRTDRSSFSERSDENIEDMMFIDTPPQVEVSESVAVTPEYRSFQVDEEGKENDELNHYQQLVQDTQYGSVGKQDLNGITVENTEVPFPYIEDKSRQESDSSAGNEIVYSFAGGNVAVYKPDETTLPPPTQQPYTTTTEVTTTTTTTTDTPAIPYQYQPPLPGLTPPPQPSVPVRKRPLVYNKRQKTGSAVSKPFEYISKLKTIINDRIFRPRPAQRKAPVGDRRSQNQENGNRRTQNQDGGVRRSQLITRRVPGRKFFFF